MCRLKYDAKKNSLVQCYSIIFILDEIYLNFLSFGVGCDKNQGKIIWCKNILGSSISHHSGPVISIDKPQISSSRFLLHLTVFTSACGFPFLPHSREQTWCYWQLDRNCISGSWRTKDWAFSKGQWKRGLHFPCVHSIMLVKINIES